MLRKSCKFQLSIVLLIVLLVMAGGTIHGIRSMNYNCYKYLGWPINDLSSSIISPTDGPILLRPNQWGQFYGIPLPDGTLTYVTRQLTASEQDFVLQAVTEAVETLNAIPDTYLKFEVGPWVNRTSNTFTDNTNYIPVTWYALNNWWGFCTLVNGPNGNTRPTGVSIDFQKYLTDDNAWTIIVSEVLHCLGVDHSALTPDLTLQDYGVLSLGAYHCHAYEGQYVPFKVEPPRPLLHYDDFTWVAHMYPDTATYNYSTGDISGEVVDSNGNPVFGAHVIAVNEKGVAMVSTISGAHEYTGQYSLGGRFILPHLPPGTYDVVITDLDDPDYPIAYNSGGHLYHSFEHNPTLLTNSYPNPAFTILRNVTVLAQYERDFGQITLGSDITNPSSTYSNYTFYPSATPGLVSVGIDYFTHPSALQYIIRATRLDGDGNSLQYWDIKEHSVSVSSTIDSVGLQYQFNFFTQPGLYRFTVYYHDGTQYQQIIQETASITSSTNVINIGGLR